jgi:hypothetical protein
MASLRAAPPPRPSACTSRQPSALKLDRNGGNHRLPPTYSDRRLTSVKVPLAGVMALLKSGRSAVRPRPCPPYVTCENRPEASRLGAFSDSNATADDRPPLSRRSTRCSRWRHNRRFDSLLPIYDLLRDPERIAPGVFLTVTSRKPRPDRLASHAELWPRTVRAN